METFLFLFRGGIVSTGHATSDQRKAYLECWDQWIETLNLDGAFVHGQPLSPLSIVVVDKETKHPLVTPEGDQRLAGFAIIRASNQEIATKHANICPILEFGGRIEVYSAPYTFSMFGFLGE